MRVYACCYGSLTPVKARGVNGQQPRLAEIGRTLHVLHIDNPPEQALYIRHTPYMERVFVNVKLISDAFIQSD